MKQVGPGEFSLVQSASRRKPTNKTAKSSPAKASKAASKSNTLLADTDDDTSEEEVEIGSLYKGKKCVEGKGTTDASSDEEDCSDEEEEARGNTEEHEHRPTPLCSPNRHQQQWSKGISSLYFLPDSLTLPQPLYRQEKVKLSHVCIR